jgi:TRAP-type C4-dicarboxylate transport system permease small subunit
VPGLVPGIHGFHGKLKASVHGRSKSGHDRLRDVGFMREQKVSKDETRLIEAEDAEVVVEHHPEDWLAFVIFWSLAFIVFLQFFTRYVLNDSLSWTEEIARYGLMWVVFIGGAMVTRRNTHIAVELLSNVMKPGPLRAALLAFVDFVKLAFIGLLAFVSWTITERMHFQRMTVFDLPMSYVYAGVAFGCFLMFARQAQNVWRNARNGWKRPDDVTHQIAPD